MKTNRTSTPLKLLSFSERMKGFFQKKRKSEDLESFKDVMKVEKYLEIMIVLKMINFDLLKLDMSIPKRVLDGNVVLYPLIFLTVFIAAITSNPLIPSLLSFFALLYFCTTQLRYDIFRQEGFKFLFLATLVLFLFGNLLYSAVLILNIGFVPLDFLYEFEAFFMISSISILSMLTFLTVYELFQVYENYKMIQRSKFSSLKRKNNKIFAK